jgi:hypothetical protein
MGCFPVGTSPHCFDSRRPNVRRVRILFFGWAKFFAGGLSARPTGAATDRLKGHEIVTFGVQSFASNGSRIIYAVRDQLLRSAGVGSGGLAG